MEKLIKFSFALIFSLGSIVAVAQDDTQSVGSTHNFKVNVDIDGKHLDDHVGNTYTWLVYKANDSGAPVDDDSDSNDDLASSTNEYTFVGTSTGTNINTVQIQWLQTGNYLVEVAETNAGTGACSTLRRIWISVTAGELDLSIAAVEVDGSDVTELTSCNDMSGQIIPRGSTNFGKSVRYFAFTMKTDDQDWTGNWGFDYTITENNSTGANSAVVEAVTADVDVSTAGKVIVTGNHPKIILKVTVDNTPGPSPTNNITLNLTATSTTPYIVTGGTNTMELAAKDRNNTLGEAYVITASPNTTDISFD